MNQDRKPKLRDWLTSLLPPWTKAAGDASGVSWVGNPDTSRIIHLGNGSQFDADELTRHIALAASAYCFTAVSYRWRTVSEPPVGIVRETEEGPEEVPNHPLDMLLKEPSPDYDMGELQALTEAYRLITGAALWVKQRASDDGRTGPVVRLVPFSGDEFTTEAADGRIYGRFFVTTASGERRQYGPEEVVYFRDTNPNSWRGHLSATDVALGQLNLGHQIGRTIKNFMLNAMFPGGVISPNHEWSPDEDEFQAYADRIKSWHSGPANAGQPLVLLGGSTFSSTSLDLKNLLPSEMLDRIEANVASVYGIPPVVLGWLVGLKNSPWSQMSEARRMTYEDTIDPRWADIGKRMSRQMLEPSERAAGMTIRFDTRDVRALQNDDAERAATAASMRREWTVNERRAYTGQEPLGDERGDEIDGGSPGVGGAELGDTSTEAGDVEGDDEDEDEKSGHRFKYADDPKGLHWLLFDVNCKAAESTWEREVAKILKAQEAHILHLARKYLKEEKGTDPKSAKKFLEEVDEFLEDTLPTFVASVYPLVYSTAKAGVKQVAAKLSLSFSILEEGLANYAEEEAAYLASVMTNTSGKAVAAAVQKGLSAGETVNALTKRLADLPAFDRARAKLTARTETTRAWNGAQRRTLSGYQDESGNRVEKSWLSSRDDRVREEHDDLDDGTWIDVDATFANGLKEPGEPNCRCTLIYRLKPEE